MVWFNGFVVQFSLVQVSKIVNGSVSNRFGLDPLEPNRTVADCYKQVKNSSLKMVGLVVWGGACGGI